MYVWHADRFDHPTTPWRVIRGAGDSRETVWGHYATLDDAKSAAEHANTETARTNPPAMPRAFSYSHWRHGGWYVDNVNYPSGAVGCVSRNYDDRKWRIVCDPRPFDQRPTFKNRDEAAAAEWRLANGL
jgi:hypothetical protein